MNRDEFKTMLGVRFFQGSVERAVSLSLEGGLVVAPSGPNLADLQLMPEYQRAISEADLPVVDSGYLALCWKFKTGQTISRLSGLAFIDAFLKNEMVKSQSEKHFWVMPTDESARRNREFLQRCGMTITPEQCYNAPFYRQGPIEDHELLAKIQSRRPRFIVINLAGGKQEILGWWLREQLDYRPTIVCTGAAIAFLTGEQAAIPDWADRFYLGWLLRIFKDPKRYFGRYWEARRLWPLVQKYGAERPPSLV